MKLIIVIPISFRNITDLTGIQDFESLEFFVIEAANITTLDLSNNLLLKSITIYDVSLESLIINDLKKFNFHSIRSRFDLSY